MKKSSVLFTMASILLSATLILSGCDKKNDDPVDVNTEDLQQLSDDENKTLDEVDEVMNDASNVMTSNTLKSTDVFPCNATVDSTSVVNDTINIVITYNGLNCRGTVMRYGQVIVKKKVGEHWGMAGASVVVKFNNLTTTRVVSNKTKVLNGTKIHTNISGGHLFMLGTLTNSIIHRNSGTLSVSFENGTSRTWQLARQITYTGTPLNLTMSIDGFGTADGYSNLTVWGVNRQGNAFYSQNTSTVVKKQECEYRPSAGITVHQIPSKSRSATITYGFDDNNQPIATGDCATKYRLDWVTANSSGTVFKYLW